MTFLYLEPQCILQNQSEFNFESAQFVHSLSYRPTIVHLVPKYRLAGYPLELLGTTAVEVKPQTTVELHVFSRLPVGPADIFHT